MKRRLILWLIFLLAVAALALFSHALPGWGFASLGFLATILANFLYVDSLMGRWLRQQKGRAVTPLDFLRDCFDLIAVFLFLSGTLLLFSCYWFLHISADITEKLFLATLWLAGISGIFLFLAAIRRIRRQRNPLAELRAKLPIKPLRKQIRETWDFQTACGFRVLGPLAIMWVVVLAAWFAVSIFFGGLGLLGIHLWENPEIISFDDWPLLLKLAVLGEVFWSSAAFATGILATHRVVHRARRVGRLPVKKTWRELGYALETVGLLGTSVWGTLMTLGILAVGAGGYWAAMAAIDFGDFGEEWLVPLWIGCSGFLGWIFLLLPQLYVMPVMVRRDCGWMRAVEVSIELLRLEGAGGIAKAILATFMVFTVVGIPGGVHLLVASLDYHDLLLNLILNEKTWREIDEELRESEAERPEALEKFYRSLEAGRYLDALNGFQMYRFSHPNDPSALRGEALALLSLGNPTARDALERWAATDEDPDEANLLLEEWYEGLWDENGPRYQEAKRRSTQEIGEGIRMSDF